jgi:hypothetical protein
MSAVTKPTGLTIIHRDAWVPEPLRDAMRQWTPKTAIGWGVVNFMRELHASGVRLPADGVRDILEALWRSVVIESELRLAVVRTPASQFKAGGTLYEDYGIVGNKVVTTAGVNYIAADFNDGGSDISAFDYAGLGTGSTAEAVGDTALVTELTTEYTGNVRTAGTPSNPSANIYRSTCTSTLDSGTPALREHGLFTASSAGTLLDRTVFASITLDGTAGDSLLSTYSLTLTAGS